MALDLNMQKVPPYLRIIIAAVPSIAIIVLFIFLIYSPKQEEIKNLETSITKLDGEIANAEVKVRKLDELKAENIRLKVRLAQLQEQLPEEKEVSPLLKQISDLGIKSGLEILLWKPDKRTPNPSGLYVEIPVKVEVIGGYHELGVFFSHISRLPRIVNIADIALGVGGSKGKQEGAVLNAKFTAITFAAIVPEGNVEIKDAKNGEKVN
ncbi:MAG: type 4a pilus biogenesis protein PilO [Nitrospirota bacterium]